MDTKINVFLTIKKNNKKMRPPNGGRIDSNNVILYLDYLPRHDPRSYLDPHKIGAGSKPAHIHRC